MNKLSHFIKLVTTGLILLLLTACLSNNSKPKNFYVLTSPLQYSALPDINDKHEISIQLKALHLPPYLNRKQIVTKENDHLLTLSDNHRWGGDLKKNLTRTLIKNLSVYLSSDSITSVSKNTALFHTYQIEVDITNYEKNKKNQVQFIATYRLFDKSKNFIKSGNLEINGATLSEKNDYSEIVDSMSRVLDEFSYKLAEIIYLHENK